MVSKASKSSNLANESSCFLVTETFQGQFNKLEIKTGKVHWITCNGISLD